MNSRTFSQTNVSFSACSSVGPHLGESGSELKRTPRRLSRNQQAYINLTSLKHDNTTENHKNNKERPRLSSSSTAEILYFLFWHVTVPVNQRTSGQINMEPIKAGQRARLTAAGSHKPTSHSNEPPAVCYLYTSLWRSHRLAHSPAPLPVADPGQTRARTCPGWYRVPLTSNFPLTFQRHCALLFASLPPQWRLKPSWLPAPPSSSPTLSLYSLSSCRFHPRPPPLPCSAWEIPTHMRDPPLKGAEPTDTSWD